MKNSIQNIPRQEGAALVVGLIVLLIMTLLGISSMSLSISELKMANNLQMQNIGFQSALAVTDLITDEDSASASIQALKWEISTPQTVGNVTTNSIASGSITTSANIDYAGCINSVEGFEISSSDQEGGSGAFKGVVHEVSAVGGVMSGTNVLSTAALLDGVRTVRPGCPL